MTVSVHLSRLELYSLEIPFQVSFEHAAAKRNTTESICVIACTDDPITAWGEACPRHYVTGETLDTARAFFYHHRRQWQELIHSIGDLQAWADHHAQEIDKNPAAWCAVEMALLDLLGQASGQSLEALLGLPEIDHSFHYSAVIGASKPQAVQGWIERYRQMGFKDFKLKLSGNRERDDNNIQAAQRDAPRGSSLRLDANNLWHRLEDALGFIQTLRADIIAIEEPLQANRHQALELLYDQTQIPIILDESFVHIDQFNLLQSRPEAWMLNLRVSKMGGILRSLAIVDKAREMNIPLIIGAQVGETSLLTRAALTIAQHAGDQLLFQEGAFGTYLLQADLAEAPVIFGQGGVLEWHCRQIPRAGLGLSVHHNSQYLRPM